MPDARRDPEPGTNGAGDDHDSGAVNPLAHSSDSPTDGASSAHGLVIPVRFDRRGRRTGPVGAEELSAELSARGATDLFVLAHGWRNEADAALSLYRRFCTESDAIASSFGLRPGAVVQHVGILWPSTRWILDGGAAGAAGAVGVADGPDPGLEVATVALFDEPDETDVLARLLQLLHDQPGHLDALQDFMDGIRHLAVGEAPVDSESDSIPDEDGLELEALFVDDWQELLTTLADAEPGPRDEGGAAGVNPFRRLWRGARAAFRLLGYWTMKRRAGIIGQDGLGPMLGELATHHPRLRVHLVGHSFGARLVSYALKGLPHEATGSASPVRSLLLLQGAFSRYAFANTLPHDPRRGGHLRGMADRVNGPLLATHSVHDSAVRYAYPLASLVARQDASRFRDPADRWRAMGDTGASEVGATLLPVGPPGTSYPFQPGAWFNVDCSRVIRRGPPPSGAHSDIIHPETAWLALAAAHLPQAQPLPNVPNGVRVGSE